MEMAEGVGHVVVGRSSTTEAVSREHPQVSCELLWRDMVSHADSLLPRLILRHLVNFVLDAFLVLARAVDVVDRYINIFIFLCAVCCVICCAVCCAAHTLITSNLLCRSSQLATM